MAIDVRKFLVRFIEEARDHIDKLNDGLAALSEGEAGRERIDALFRAAHTVKGSSRMLRLLPITETAHRFEDVLGALREGALTFDPALASLLYRASDALAAQVDRLAETLDGQSLPPADEALCRALAEAASGRPGTVAASGAAAPSASGAPATGDAGGGLPAVVPVRQASPVPDAAAALQGGQGRPEPPAPGADAPGMGEAAPGTAQAAASSAGPVAASAVAPSTSPAAAWPGVANGAAAGPDGGAGEGAAETAGPGPRPEPMTPQGAGPAEGSPASALAPVPEPDPASAVPPAGEAGIEPIAAPAEAALGVSETVRVRLGKLDELIKLMGEVVSSHARMRQRLGEVRDLEKSLRDRLPEAEAARLHRFVLAFADDVQAQEGLKAELHDKTLVMRMLPLAVLFEPAARLVRELARSLGKQVSCQVRGAAIELDRQMIDSLSDPITHLLRNSLDHGLEPAASRLAAGKPAQGRLRLSARQDGGFVVVEVADDGAGIALDAVRDKAVQKGLVAPARAGAVSEREVLDLIFLPGFSTKAGVSDMSGRGVGMDVVKQCVVGDLRGSVEVATRPGAGTTFSLRLPLSLAIMRVLLVAVQGTSLAFTAQYVDEVARVPRQALLEATGRLVVDIRGSLVPLVSLADVVRLPETGPGGEPGPAGPRDTLLLVVLRVGGESLALRVDALLDERDLVIKPLPAHLRRLTLVAGMVTTGENALVSVLHAPALLELARRGGVARPPGTSALRQERRPYALLVVDDSASTREIEKDVLEAHGYAVTLAVDGQDGLEAAMAGDFDAILTDVEMPLLDGFELTSRLRREERYRHRPIVIITSRENEADKRRGLQVGADAYIVKGDFAQGSLVQTLRALLG
ncbi:hybrid sensor histidine kinase/response regulator [Solidesulfovibrio sp.]|uniref:hybrid sensor histidine kinase/response regulator n=1 Tax=Solidesulfovibrio sp. TaxID=2910990 RepID=UPI002B1F1B02|nr:hybrid sensor histidine kinase/response regulator [Solidesulfovibrio sp.]MEA4857180.1 hybrid sensor histidine kinase/response regulator [Solidesulfovibrio sp.]